MANTPDSTENRASNPTGATLWSTKVIVALVLLLVLLLLLVDHYPRVIIGFMVLVLVGVILSHAGVIKNFFNF